MQTYELLYMIPPSLSETEIDGVGKLVNGYISKAGGQTTKEDRWGVRKLAYPIGQFHQANFILLDVVLDEQRVAELDQSLRREEQVLRHLVTSVRPKTPDQIEGERRLAEERANPQASSLTDEPKPKGERVGATASAAQRSAEPQPQARPKLKSDDVTALEDEAKQAKEKPSEPGFLQEQSKAKDINLEDLDKKIDEILEDDML